MSGGPGRVVLRRYPAQAALRGAAADQRAVQRAVQRGLRVGLQVRVAADLYELPPTSFVTHVNNKPMPDLVSFLAAVVDIPGPASREIATATENDATPRYNAELEKGSRGPKETTRMPLHAHDRSQEAA